MLQIWALASEIGVELKTHMKAIILILLIGGQILGLIFRPQAKIRKDDIQILIGAQWTGVLSYRDYRSNTRVSIPANLMVTPNGEDKWSWVFDYQYPDEPQANSKNIVRLTKDGKSLDGEAAIERTKLSDGTVILVTEKNGQDNNRSAYFRFTYKINSKEFTVKKEVRYEDESRFFKRNEFSWKR